LNLNIPSFLGGGVYLGSGTTVNVVSGASNSVLWSATGTLTGSPSLSGPVPIFFNASTGTIATFDPTGFAGASDVLADTTGNVSKLVHSRLDGLGNRWWMSGFGSAAKYDGSTATLERDYRHVGMALGYDTKVSPDLTLGALIGYGRGNFKADSSYARSFDNESNGEFVGIYGQQRWQDMFVNVALSAGFLKHTDARFVNDNSASLGISGSRALYTSRWVSPQATVGMNVDLGEGWTAIPAVHLRYAWQSVKGYSETGGGDANAQVGQRTVQMVESRPELGVRKTLQFSSVGPLTVEGRVGGLYRSALGDNTVRLTMIDQSKQVATEMRDRSAAFVGMALSLDLRNNVTFKLHGETVFGDRMRSFNGLAMLSAKF
jgi:outer membrane autotransporter protein